jgi:hypothetical protein
MADPMTPTTIWPRLAAQDRHVPKAAVASPLSTFGPRRPASAMHGHLAARASGSTIGSLQ